MMKQSFLYVLFFSCFFSGLALAQNIPVSYVKSEVFKDEYKYSQIALVKEDGAGGVLIVRTYQGGLFSSGIGYYFEHYDANLKLIKEFDFPLKYSEVAHQSSVLGVITRGDDIHLINFMYRKDEKAYVCSAMTATIQDFVFQEKELFRLNSDEIKQFGFSSQFDGDSGASMIVNEDRTAFAVTVDIKNKNAETHKLFLFDNALQKKIEHTFVRDIKDTKFRYENIDVSKDGSTLYLLGKVFSDEKKKKKEGGKYQFELTKISNDGAVTQTFDTEEHFSNSLKTIVFEDRLVCIGFYSDRNDSRYKGISYFELDPQTLAIRKTQLNPFTEQFLVDKYGKSKDKELKNVSFRSLLITPTNEIVFNAEEYYMQSYYVPAGQYGGGYWRYVYHYDDIISAKINTQGSLVWARNINKRQSTEGDESYISYTSTVKGDDTYFFINTSEKVKKLSHDRILFGQTSKNHSNLNVIKVNASGDFDYQEILDDKDNEVPFLVAYGAITKNQVFFIGRRGKKKQLLKVSL